LVGDFDCNLNGILDGCEEDSDDDGIINACDNCISTANPDQNDLDSDGVGDECDNCPLTYNAEQLDFDGDGVGYVCDICLDVNNPEQIDTDDDGIGDECDSCPTVANPEGDVDEDCYVNFVDFALLALDWLYIDCNPLNRWCDGSDLYQDGEITAEDFNIIADAWLDCSDPNPPCNYVP
jgi:hypothetical protein